MCAENLARNPRVDEVLLADMETGAAEALRSRLKSDKVSVERTDGTDSRALKRLMKGRDMIVSSMPWQLNRKVLNTAIAMGIDYVDFCLTVESMEDFEDLRSQCSDAGIRALTAMGEDPGISDVFARRGANMLDHAEEAHVKDGDSGSAEGYEFFSLWSPVDLVEEATVPAAVFRDGKISYLPPLHKKEIYRFPDPIGPLPVYNTIHEETFLMSRFIEGLKVADFQIAIDDGFAATANMLRKLGLSGLKPVDVKGTKVRPIDVVVALMPRPVDLAGKVKGHAGIVVEVIGTKGGKRKKAKLWTIMSHEKAYEMCKSNATGYLVGVGGAVAAEMVIDGEVKDRGLIVPEQLPSEKFIARLPAKGLKVEQELVDL